MSSGSCEFYLLVRVILHECHSIRGHSRDVTQYALATWPVTGQGFQNTKWPAVLYILSKFHKIERFQLI